jgi:anti-sigma B factor antagonist
LTWSESEAKVAARRLAGEAADASVAIAEFLLPGMGTVFALGFGKVTLLRLAAARAASAVGLHVMNGEKNPEPVVHATYDGSPEVPSDEKSKYAAFFREVLKEGRSLVVVRTESREVVAEACVVLDRLGLQPEKLGLEERTSAELRITSRVVGDAVVLDMSGRITVGEGNLLLREMVGNLQESGKKNIVLNLGEVTYVDSSGLGELVKTHATIRNVQGQVKLVNLSKRVEQLLQMTKLSSVFDIYKDETSAIGSFRGQSSKQAMA